MGAEALKNEYLIIINNPSQDSSVCSISAWCQRGPRFKSRQVREFLNENNLLCGKKHNIRSLERQLVAWACCSPSYGKFLGSGIDGDQLQALRAFV